MGVSILDIERRELLGNLVSVGLHSLDWRESGKEVAQAAFSV
jgi:hypothetical protein